jgi:hypothetical protein
MYFRPRGPLACFLAGLGCAAALLATAALVARGEGTDDEVERVRIRRVLLPAERVAAEMERARVGVLKQVPLEEFEDLVRRASRATADLQKQPLVVEAKYRARLEGADLVGTAAWKVHNPGPATRLLRLDPFNLALQEPPTFENRPAHAGDFDGKKPALLLDEVGLRTISLDWSAHGEASADGVNFDLNLPPATVGTLDLSLPTDFAVVPSPDGYAVTGPLPADTPGRQSWQVGFTRGRPLRLGLRRLDGAARDAPLLTAKLEAKQQLTPDGLDAEYAFDFRALHREIREMECACDPLLRPVEISVPELEAWEVRPAAASAPTLLRVRFRRPLREGTLRIQCFAPLHNGTRQAWTSPTIRLAGAVPRGERLQLQVHPDVGFTDWRPGNFRVEKAATETDGTRTFTLSGGGFALSPASAPETTRPSARLEATGVEYQARQLAWWQVQPRKSSLTCQISYEALRGRLFQLPLELPAGWRVERVELNPPTLLRDWEERQERGVSVLIVALQRPLAPPAGANDVRTSLGLRTARLTVRLGALGPAMEWAFPDVAPRGARCREGALAIDFDEQAYRARVETAATSSEQLEDGPWGSQKPDIYYPYYGDPARGTLRLEPREPRVSVRCTSEVVLASDKAALVAHVLLQPGVGSPDGIDLLTSVPEGRNWHWKTVQGNNLVSGFEPVPRAATTALAVLGARTALDAAIVWQSGLRLPPEPQLWRLTLARPLREPLSLDAACEITRGPDGRWDVPLLATPPPNESENEVTLFLAGADLIQVQSTGLREATGAIPSARGQPGSPWRTFHYSTLPASLRLHGRALAADPVGGAVVDRAALTTYVERSGRLVHLLRFHLGNWRQRLVPLRLPAGAQLLAARLDGRWIARIAPSAVAESGDLVELPVSQAGESERPRTQRADTNWHTYEIVYATAVPSWRVWTDLPPPPPILPVAPLTFLRTWRLPQGVVPLYEHCYRCLPSALGENSPEEGLPFPLEAAWPTALRGTTNSEWEDTQRRHVREAGTALSKGLEGKSVPLGEVIERLAFEHLSAEALVLDGEALRQAGLNAGSLPIALADRAAPPWEAFGLVYVPCQPAPVLTTRRAVEDWYGAARLARRSARTGAPPVSPSIVAAVDEAAAHGHDASCRFRVAAEWLHASDGAARAPDDATAGVLQTMLGELHAEYWTEWEAVAGAEGDGRLVVVRHDALPGIGLAAAALACLGFWLLPERARLGALLAWLALGGLAYFWLLAPLRVLGWWPLLGGLAVALAWYLASAARRQKLDREPKPTPGPAPAAVPLVSGGLLLLALAWSWACPAGLLRAEEPEEQIVFLVREADGDKFVVLAPPELLDRLKAQSQRADTPTNGAVLVSAEYEGKVAGDVAELKAEFQVYYAGEGSTLLHLPLDGVQLDGETLLDGARVYPEAVRPPRLGYTLKIEKTGSPVHRLSMHFRAPVRSMADDRELLLTLPGVVRSRLMLDLPEGARAAEALAGDVPVRGRQRMSALPTGSRLEADLGRLGTPLRLRWSQAVGTAQPAEVRAKEAYSWDLRPDTATLTALLRYAVTRGAPSALALEVPEALEVLSVRVSAATGRGGVRLKSWRISGTGAGRRLEIEFQNPVSGDLTAVVQLAPRRPLLSGEELPLPIPKDAQVVESLLACQFSGLEARLQAQGLTVFDREQFAAPWRLLVMGDPRIPWLPDHAFSFDRGATGAPSLKLDLQISAPRIQAVQRVAWRVAGAERADFAATIGLTVPAGNLTLVEWEVPPELTVARISGSELGSWSQTDTRIQAWLDGARGPAELQVSGWLKSVQASPAPAPKPAADQFRLPCLQILSAAAVENWIHLSSANGSILEVVDRADLMPLPDPRPSAPDLGFFTRHARYHATFRLQQPPRASEARVFTLAEMRGRQLAFRALVEIQAERGDARTATLELRDWPGIDVQCEVLEGAARASRTEGGPIPQWTIELQAGANARYRFGLTGSVPLDQIGADTALPNVRVGGVSHVERWLAVGGVGELRPEAKHGLEPALNAPRALGVWADPLRREAATAWRVTADDARLMLRLPAPSARTPAPQLLLAEQECAVVDGRHWAYETTFWIYHEANTDVTVVLPAHSRLFAVAVDDAGVTPLQPAPGRLWVPLPGQAGGRRLRLRWAFDGDGGPEHPRLHMPYLDGVDDGPTAWTVHVPAGYRPAPAGETLGQPRRTAVPASAAGLELRRAACHYQLSAILASKLRAGDSAVLASLASAQRRFYNACRNAEQNLAMLDVGGDAGPDGQLLGEWVGTMREENRQLARQHGFESLRAEAERQAQIQSRALSAETDLSDRAPAEGAEAAGIAGRLGAWPDDFLPQRGTPLYWQGAAGAASPRLQLNPIHARSTQRALGLSVAWLILLTAIGIAARLPNVRAWFRLFWPEQVALLGCLIWQAFGPNILLLFLIVTGICGRVILLTHRLLRWARRSTSLPPAAPAA